jgi:hypothetical protein
MSSVHVRCGGRVTEYRSGEFLLVMYDVGVFTKSDVEFVFILISVDAFVIQNFHEQVQACGQEGPKNWTNPFSSVELCSRNTVYPSICVERV